MSQGHDRCLCLSPHVGHGHPSFTDLPHQAQLHSTTLPTQRVIPPLRFTRAYGGFNVTLIEGSGEGSNG
jgi:hypothetical protein